MYATITADGQVTQHEGTPSLADLQAASGGFVETIRLDHDDDTAVMWVAEDGIRLALPINLKATRLARNFAHVGPGPILGGVTLTGPADREGDITSLDAWWASVLSAQVAESA